MVYKETIEIYASNYLYLGKTKQEMIDNINNSILIQPDKDQAVIYVNEIIP